MIRWWAEGLLEATAVPAAPSECWAVSTCGSVTGEVLGCSGRTAPGTPTTARVLSTLTRPNPVPRSSRATIVTAGRRVREVIGLTGPYAAVDEKLTGREN